MHPMQARSPDVETLHKDCTAKYPLRGYVLGLPEGLMSLTSDNIPEGEEK